MRDEPLFGTAELNDRNSFRRCSGMGILAQQHLRTYADADYRMPGSAPQCLGQRQTPRGRQFDPFLPLPDAGGECPRDFCIGQWVPALPKYVSTCLLWHAEDGPPVRRACLASALALSRFFTFAFLQPAATMKTLALISQKGGVGKTTLAAHLGVQAALGWSFPAALAAAPGPRAAGARRRGSARAASGSTVALVDADPQGSLSAWWNRREASAPLFVGANLARLERQLAQLSAEGVDLVIIDTPPALGETITRVARVADLILIPVRPSPHDLRAVGATVDLVEHLNRPLAFVVSGATARTRIAAEAAVALSQHGRVAPVTVHHRTDFASSMTDGRTVMELFPAGRSAGEIAELWKYVNPLLAKCVDRHSAAA